MCSDLALRVEEVHKSYLLFARPLDRLLQSLWRGRRRLYNEVQALQPVSLSVRHGETVGIVGRNGSGKSTLLQLICGTVHPSGGTVTAHGRISALLELGAGFNPEFTGRENVYLNAAILGLSPQETEACYPDIVAFANIGTFIDQPVKTYSSGMYLRLAFAVAIAVEPDILVVDEALAVGDEAFQRKCYARIRDLQSRGGTVLFVSHSAQAVLDLCSRAVLMDKGELLLDGPPKQVMSQYHRLIYAAPEEQETIRNAIRAGETPEAMQAEPPLSDASLSAESRVAYTPRGARIRDPHIETPEGETVNQLHRCARYIYTYEVTFDADARDVRFGMVLKTTSGFALGGMASAKEGETLPLVTKGQRLRVTFPFDCLLTHGTYFINCGCSAVENGERVFLHRIIDACMFRVLPDDDSRISGPVDFRIEPEVTALC